MVFTEGKSKNFFLMTTVSPQAKFLKLRYNMNGLLINLEILES